MPRASVQASMDASTDALPETVPSLTGRLRMVALVKLKNYARLKAQLAELEKEIDAAKTEITAIREKAGVNAFECDGFQVTQVIATRSKLNEKRLIALGCSPKWIEEATEHVANKPYDKITTPKKEAVDE